MKDLDINFYPVLSQRHSRFLLETKNAVVRSIFEEKDAAWDLSAQQLATVNENGQLPFFC